MTCLPYALELEAVAPFALKKPELAVRMKIYTFPKRNRMGSVLIALQFGLFLLIVSLAFASIKISHAFTLMPALTLAGASVCLAAWTLVHNKPGNFNFCPQPKTWSVFVCTGPYQWIRHPMYTSLLLGTGALALTSIPFFGGLAWTVLAVLLFLVSILEERWMREQHPEYGYYARERKRFLPWIF